MQNSIRPRVRAFLLGLVLLTPTRNLQVLAAEPASSQPPVASTSSEPETSVAHVAMGHLQTLPATHPDVKAVRAILDANGLKARTVESVSVVRNGRIVELYLQDGGIAELTGDIGSLTALQKLHLYGDRSLQLPLLTKISPAIGQCAELQELLINQNDLTTLPVEITNLQKLKVLSLADNHLLDLAPAVHDWAKKYDPKGLDLQNGGGSGGKP